MDENGMFARVYAEKRRQRAARERDAQRKQRREARESASKYQKRRGSMPRRAMTTYTKEIT